MHEQNVPQRFPNNEPDLPYSLTLPIMQNMFLCVEREPGPEMKENPVRPIIISLLTLCLATPALAQNGTYTVELAHSPKFAKAYQEMTHLPAWVTGTDAVSVPTKSITLAGHSYIVGHVCKPHDCGDNQLEIVFSDNGKAAWGLLSRVYGKTVYQMPLGEPDATILDALQASYRANNPN